MLSKHAKIAAASAAVLVTAILGAATMVAPAASAAVAMPSPAPITAEEHLQTIAAMKPPKRARPLIAIVGHNDGTETTDFLIPYAILKESGAADVVALATKDGPLKLKPALTIRADQTTATFDTRHPDGADYVIVPAIADRYNPEVIAWVQAQAAKGATIVGICAGSVTLSKAGLLAGHAATGHWHDVPQLRKDNPTMRWVQDRRYVADRGLVTTTGVSASLPVSLALVEAIAGRARAAELAQTFGVANWDARHDSSAFQLDGKMLRVALGNTAAIWNRDVYGVPVSAGVDEIALSFTADAWSRTFRSQALTVVDGSGEVRTQRGLTLVPDRVAGDRKGLQTLPLPDGPAGQTLPAALAAIETRYGGKTAAFIALQLEYPWRAGGGR